MCRQQIVITLATIIIGSVLTQDNVPQDNNDWPGLWFPNRPHGKSREQVHSIEETMQSKLVRNDDTLRMSEINLNGVNQKWNGLWFPGPPGQTVPITSQESSVSREGISRFLPIDDSSVHCDDGTTILALDYDPGNITHHARHMCLSERSLYAPIYNLNPRLLDYTIPPEYRALQKCMDQPIEYDNMIPTFGTHRKLWPVYGEYVYVPPQRWIHSLEHGGIVLLYHPCANLIQLDIVKNLIKKCLYRHIITAYDLLEPERPFALVAWGRSLEFSVVDQLVVVSFIRLYALQGPEKIFSDGQYNQTLIEQANIISSADDDVLCQNL